MVIYHNHVFLLWFHLEFFVRDMALTRAACLVLPRTFSLFSILLFPPLSLPPPLNELDPAFGYLGPLSMVMEIKRNSSTINWEPPFSLDLTGVDPDIVYCVEVYNITCGVDDLVVGDCNVTEARYVDNGLQQGHIYRITITPRSNVQGVQNGTYSTKEGIIMKTC